jgi:peptidoglycan/xylan/chitin deacetylase (PgdA/CDA1 family)
MRVAEVLAPERKLACITLDFETDYGDRIGGAFHILDEKEKLAELARLYRDLDVPVSAFIRTDLLERHPRSVDLVRELAEDLHCHSHTHAMTGFESEREIAETQATFTRVFGAPALGYRAPLGIVRPGEIELLARHGFRFSSSIFPVFFPGRFDNRGLPASPFVYENGIVELPFAAVPRARTTISLSFLKLFGETANRALFSAFGLPTALVFDSHLHDYIVCEESFRQLPFRLRCAWSVNKHEGLRYFARFVEHLRREGYELVTMTRLYEYVLSLRSV